MKEIDIRLPYLISDGMILQRNRRIKIWGKAFPGRKLCLTLCNSQYTTTVEEDGRWEISLSGLQEGGPFQMTVECGEKKKIIRDILIGDVFVLGGQSNMEMMLKKALDFYGEEIRAADYPAIRRFTVPEKYNFHAPIDELTGGEWVPVNPETVYDFSAVGYFFAKALYEKYRIPIGLIHTAVGGTPAEAWISEKSLRDFGCYEDTLSLCKQDEYVKTVLESDDRIYREWFRELNERDKGLHDTKALWYAENCDASSWRVIELPRSFKGTEMESIRGAVWFRKEFYLTKSGCREKAKLVLGTIINADETYLNGIRIGSNDSLFERRRYDIPDGILKEGRNVLAVRVIMTRHMGAFVTDMPYFLKINEDNIPLSGSWRYRPGTVTEPLPQTVSFQFKPAGLYNAMIYPLRKYGICGVLWYQGESNTNNAKGYKELFETVIRDWRNAWNLSTLPFYYVQLANYCPWREEPEISGWAGIREEQRKVMDEDPYTGMAVACDVGEYNDIHPRDKKSVGNRLALWVMNKLYGEGVVCSGPIYQGRKTEGDKIRVFFTHTGSGLMVKGEALNSFEICGQEGSFVKAQAYPEGETVIVFSETVKEPADVRYAWRDNPEEANLYNGEGLPASPFTTRQLQE